MRAVQVHYVLAKSHLHDLHEPVDEDGPHADVDVMLHDLHVRRRRAPLQLRINACFCLDI